MALQLRGMLAALATLFRGGEMHPEPVIPTDEQMDRLSTVELAALLCGDRSRWFAGAIRHHEQQLGRATMLAICQEVRATMQRGQTHRPHVLMSVLIRRAEIDASELGIFQV